ncbi:HNH endonuclease [Paracoccus endophyticus]|uniref:HNH endonuclease n=1 Tax=Paracoccus endophyticus TaxID=2233774 RepID=UPI000DD8CA9F|nr:HNH endonuclease [Paracoccus endophyticus]
MKTCIKDPVPAVFAARDNLAAAVDAHLAGDPDKARRRFRAADTLAVFFWLNPCWYDVEKNVVDAAPAGDSCVVPKEQRDRDRGIAAAVRTEVLARDGYRCRYCGLPVIDATIRKIAHALYPDAVPWDSRDLRRQHAGFAALWLQYDHVVPHSHGGRSNAENVVIACGLCNFGKHGYTLRQLGLSDPRLRLPEPTEWDGLQRLRHGFSKQSREAARRNREAPG